MTTESVSEKCRALRLNTCMRQLAAVVQMAAEKKLGRAENHRAPVGAGTGSPQANSNAVALQAVQAV